MTRIERAQVLSCIPSTRGVQVFVEGLEEESDLDDDEFDEDDADWRDD